MSIHTQEVFTLSSCPQLLGEGGKDVCLTPQFVSGDVQFCPLLSQYKSLHTTPTGMFPLPEIVGLGLGVLFVMFGVLCAVCYPCG